MRGHAVAWGGSRRKQQQQRIENRCTGLLRLKLVLNVFMLAQSLDSIHHHPFIRVPDLSLCASRALGLFFSYRVCVCLRGLLSDCTLSFHFLIGDQLMTRIIIMITGTAPGCVSVRGERHAHAAIVAQGGRWLSAKVSFRISGVMPMRPSRSSGAHPNFHHRIRTLCHSNPSVETAS